MMTAQTEFRQRLERKIADEIAEAAAELCNGYAPDYANYQYRVGSIRALRLIIELCEEVEKEMS